MLRVKTDFKEHNPDTACVKKSPKQTCYEPCAKENYWIYPYHSKAWNSKYHFSAIRPSMNEWSKCSATSTRANSWKPPEHIWRTKSRWRFKPIQENLCKKTPCPMWEMRLLPQILKCTKKNHLSNLLLLRALSHSLSRVVLIRPLPTEQKDKNSSFI